jgi:hypothetical protein
MPTTQLTLDLGSVWGLSKYLLAACLFTTSAFVFVLPWLRELWFRMTETPAPAPIPGRPIQKPKRKDVDRSSDTPPPAGFADHLRIIEATAPNADPNIWWEYAKAEMTEAEVAMAEARLARISSPVVVQGNLGGGV